MKKILSVLAIILCLGGCANMCGECEYTSTQPVEIVYRKTTYKTVYVPKTYKYITYERKPYNRCEQEKLCR